MLEMSGRMLAWSVEMRSQCPQYKSRTTKKAQALANFVVEFSFNKGKELKDLGQKDGEGKVRTTEENKDNHTYQWNLHLDGAAGPIQNGAETILEEPNRLVVSYALWFDFPISNNMTKYEALINDIQLEMGMGVSDLKFLSDSQLVVNQV